MAIGRESVIKLKDLKRHCCGRSGSHRLAQLTKEQSALASVMICSVSLSCFRGEGVGLYNIGCTSVSWLYKLY